MPNATSTPHDTAKNMPYNAPRLKDFRPYWQVTLAAFLGWLLDAFDQTCLMFTLPDIARDFNCTLTALGSVLLGQAVGRAIGNTGWGWLSDRYGRKPAFMLGVLWFAIFSALTGLCHNLLTLGLVQFLFGVGFGGEWTASATLLMESVPERLRPMASALMMSGYELGYFAAVSAQALILPYYGWRLLFFIGIIPALLSFFVRVGVKESPIWLANRDTISDKNALHDNTSGQNAFAREKSGNSVKTASIFQFDFLWAGLQALGLMCFLQFQKAALYTFYPTILRDSHHLPPQALFWPITLYCLGSLAGKLLCGKLAGHFGEVRVMIGAILVVIISIWPFFCATSWAGLLVAAFVTGSGASGIFALVPHYLAQRFSSTQRSLGMGMSYAVGSLGQGLASKLVPLLGPSAASLPFSAIGLVVGTSFVSTAILAFKPKRMPKY